MLVEIFPRRGSIEVSDTDLLNHIRIEVSCVHADAARGGLSCLLPVRDTAAVTASNEADALLCPEIRRGRAAGTPDPDVASVEVGPEHAIAAANRTIAQGQGTGPSGQCNPDGSAMAACFDHRKAPGEIARQAGHLQGMRPAPSTIKPRALRLPVPGDEVILVLHLALLVDDPAAQLVRGRTERIAVLHGRQ
jgi:hypothetical protein